MKKWLKFDEISDGTKIRTFFEIVAVVVASYYTYQGMLDDLLNQLGLGKVAVIIALIAVIAMIIVQAVSTYYNNDYSKGASIGTAIGRQFNEDPTINISVYDADEDDDDDEDEDDGDVEIKEGEADEVEQ